MFLFAPGCDNHEDSAWPVMQLLKPDDDSPASLFDERLGRLMITTIFIISTTVFVYRVLRRIVLYGRYTKNVITTTWTVFGLAP